MVFVPEAKTLYAGNILFIEPTPVMWAGPLENWLAALDLILEKDVAGIVPGHGPITDKNGVRQVKAFWEFVKSQVQQRYNANLSAEEAAYDIVLSHDFAQQPFVQWNSPEMMMTSVHTLYRHLRGRSDRHKALELLNIMRKQALLAHHLPDAAPSVMRKQ